MDNFARVFMNQWDMDRSKKMPRLHIVIRPTKNAYNFCLDYAQTLLRDFTDSILYKGSTIVKDLKIKPKDVIRASFVIFFILILKFSSLFITFFILFLRFLMCLFRFLDLFKKLFVNFLKLHIICVVI